MLGRDQAPRPFLVLGIGEGKEIADRDRGDARRLELARGAAHIRLIERLELRAGEIDAAADLAGQALRRERLGLAVEVVERVGVADLALHFLDGAEALGDEEPDLGAAHFQERVGGDGRAVGEELDRARAPRPWR